MRRQRRSMSIEEEAREVRAESALLRADMSSLREDIKLTQIELNAFARQLKKEHPTND